MSVWVVTALVSTDAYDFHLARTFIYTTFELAQSTANTLSKDLSVIHVYVQEFEVEAKGGWNAHCITGSIFHPKIKEKGKVSYI